MNWKTALLIAALAVMGTGFGFAILRTSSLQKQVVEQERRLAGLERGAAADSSAEKLASARDEIRDLRGQVERLSGRVDRASGRAAQAAASAPAGDGSALVSVDPQNQTELEEALDSVLEDRKARDKQAKAERDAQRKAERDAARPERDKARRLSDFTRRFGLDASQARSLQPILEDHHAQLTPLMDRLQKAPEAEKPLIKQQIVALRQTAQDRYRAYMNPDQIARMERYYDEANRGLLGLPRQPQAQAPQQGTPAR